MKCEAETEYCHLGAVGLVWLFPAPVLYSDHYKAIFCAHQQAAVTHKVMSKVYFGNVLSWKRYETKLTEGQMCIVVP